MVVSKNFATITIKLGNSDIKWVARLDQRREINLIATALVQSQISIKYNGRTLKLTIIFES